MFTYLVCNNNHCLYSIRLKLWPCNYLPRILVRAYIRHHNRNLLHLRSTSLPSYNRNCHLYNLEDIFDRLQLCVRLKRISYFKNFIFLINKVWLTDAASSLAYLFIWVTRSTTIYISPAFWKFKFIHVISYDRYISHDLIFKSLSS